MEKEILELLKEMKDNISQINTKLSKVEEGQEEIKTKLDEFQIEYTNTLKDLSDKIDEVTIDVKAIKKDLCRVEEATASNWVDIAKLKAAK